MSFFRDVLPTLATLDYVNGTHRAVQQALEPPTLEQVLAAENAALRDSLAQWQEYAGRVAAENAALREALRTDTITRSRRGDA